MSIRSKVILVALVVVVGVAAGGYAAAPWLLATVAVRSLEGIVEVRELKIESVGLSQIDIAAVQVTNQGIRFGARDASVRFDPWPFRVRGVDIRNAELVMTGTPGEEGLGAAPALPPFPVRVDELSLRLETAWGRVAFPASVESTPGAGDGMNAEINSAGFSAVLRNPGANRHELELLDAGGAVMLSLTARTGGGFPVEFDGRLATEALAPWLQESPVVPAALRPLLAPYELSGGPVEVRGALEQNLDFAAELRGDVALRDAREAAEQLFASIELKMKGYTVSRSGASWSGSGEAGFRYAPDAETSFTGRDPAWRWNDEGVSFNTSAARLEPMALEAETVEASASGLGADDAEGGLRADGLRLAGWPEALGYYDVSGNWSLDGASLDAGGTGNGAGLPQLSWRLKTAGSAGSFELDVRDNASAVAPSLEPYTAVVAGDLAVLSGQLHGRYRTEWDAQGERATLGLEVEAVDADLGGMEIRGMNVRVDSLGNDIDRLGINISAPTLKLAAGTVAEDLEMALRLAPPGVHLDTARTRLFGGRISLRPVTFSTDDETIVVIADIDALSLEKVMALMELETTQLTGEVAGPVRIVFNRDTGIEINKGDLHSVHAGVLRLRMSQDSSMAAQLDNIALRALENFQYDELNASVLYKPDGEYRITARILGRNPKVLNGHPIALNPTIEGRLPALFRAFFITGDFNEAIIQRLQEERGLSTPGETSTLQED